MVKKLLLKVLTFWALLLTSALGWGQCPSSVTITADPSTTICAGEAITFTANHTDGQNPTYQWQINGVNVSGETGQTFTRGNLSNGDKIRVVVKSSSDASCVTNSEFVTVTVNPKPTVTTSNTTTICSGASPNISLAASTASSFSWTIGTITGGITGASADDGATINQTLTNPSSSTVGTVKYIVTPTSNSGSCEGEPYTITVTVNPTPTVTTSDTTTICSGSSPNIALTASTPSSFSWTIGSITGGITGASNGTGSTINQTLTNPSNSAAGTVQYIVTPTANAGSCAGEPYTITVTVNPKPTVTTVNTATICSGTGPDISLTASAPSTFSWTVGTITGGITGASNGTGSTINQTLTNPSNSAAGTVQYIVTPTANTGSCAGEPYKITVTVNPKPTVTTSSTVTICSGGNTNISLTASTPSTFSWTIGSNPGNISGASAGSGPTINQILTNPSNTTAGTVEYIVTPTTTTGNCAGEPYKITVTVNPKPTVTTSSTATICSGSSPNIALTASTASSFSWTIGTITGSIIGASAGSGSTINQILTNPSNTTVGTVQYIVTPTSTTGYCAGEPFTITVTVNEVPIITSTTPGNVCDSGTVTLSATASAGTVKWYESATGGDFLKEGTSYTTPALTSSKTYYVEATANSCTLSSRTPIEATVTTTPTITSTTNGSRCGSGTVELKATASAGTVHWYADNTSNNVLATGNSYSPNISNTTTFYVAAVLNGCSSARTAVTAKKYTSAPTTTTGANAASQINGPNSVCPPATDIVYTIPSNMTQDAEWYEWKLPPGFVVTSGEKSKEIIVDVSTEGAVIGNHSITVTAHNPCGSATSRSFTVNVNSFADVDAGEDFSQCLGQSKELTNELLGNASSIAKWEIIPGPNGTSDNGEITGGPWNNDVKVPFLFTPNSAGIYTLRVTTNTAEGACSAAASTGTDEVTITVNSPSVVPTSINSSASTICEGTQITLSQTGGALGTDAVWKWYSDANYTTTVEGSVAADGTLTIAPTETTTYYIRAEGNAGPCDLTVDGPATGVTVTVNEPSIAPTALNASISEICNGSNTEVTLSQTDGILGTGSVWKWYTDSNYSTAYTGTVAADGSITVSPTETTTYYIRAENTADPCQPIVEGPSEGITVTVNAPSQAPTALITSVSEICNGDNTAVTLSQEDGVLGTGAVWKWYMDSNYSTAYTGTVASDGSITVSPTETTTYYIRAENTADPCQPIVEGPSEGITVTVNERTVAPTALNATQTEICDLDNIQVILSQSGGTLGTEAVWKWYTDSNYTTPVDGSAATDGSITVSPTETTTYYIRAEGNAGPCNSTVNGPADGITVTVNESSSAPASLHATQTEICNLETTQVTLSQSGGTLGSDAEWKWYEDANYSIPIEGTVATDGSITVSPTETTTYYLRAEGNAGPCDTAVNGPAAGVTVTVNEPVEIVSDLDNSTVEICAGFPVSFSIEATGTGLSYKWTRNGEVVGTNSPTIEISQVAESDEGTYKVLVKGKAPCTDISSEEIYLVVNQSITFNTGGQPTAEIFSCEGDTDPVTISVDVDGTTSEYLWRKDGIPLSDGGNISGATTAKLTISDQTASDSGSYDVVISSPAESCSQIISNPSVVTVNSKSDDPTSASTDVTDNKICFGGSTVLTLNGGGGGTGEVIKWYSDIAASPIGTGNDFQVSPEVTTTFYARYEDPEGCYQPSAFASVEVTVNFDSTITLSAGSGSDDQTICINNELTSISYDLGGGATGASITEGNLPEGLIGEITGESPNQKFIISGTPTEAGTFHYTITADGPCDEASLSGTIIVNDDSVLSLTSAEETSSQTICVNNAVVDITYKIAGGAISAALVDQSLPQGVKGEFNNGIFTISGTPTEPGIFNYTITTDGNCVEDTLSGTITVNDVASVNLSSSPETSAQTLCINNTITPITYSVGGGATGVELTGTLPEGIVQNYDSENRIFTISGTATSAGIFEYTITTTGPCENNSVSGKITIEDDSSIALTSGEETSIFNVCINADLNPISYSIGGGATGATISAGELPTGLSGKYEDGNFIIEGTPTVAGTYEYAITTTGPCQNVSLTGSITVDPLPIGGTLSFETIGRIFMICENPSKESLAPLSLDGITGQVIVWKYRKSSSTSWIPIQENGSNYTGSTLSRDQIYSLGLDETISFQVEIGSGSCTPNVLSTRAILSVIPSDIEPAPVTIAPGVVCFGANVTLSSSTGYASGGDIGGGEFDTANSLTSVHGWRVRRDGSNTDLDFPAGGNNTRPNIWSNTNDHPFYTANINGSGGSDVRWDSGDKKFAIVAGNNPSTLETPVFNTYAMESGRLTFDQAYNLTPGASIRVEISRDGGISYESVPLYEVISTKANPAKSDNFDGFGTSTSTKNKISINLENYLGEGNLRIRFHFLGKNDGDVWALDAIDFPDGPNGVGMVWKDYTDPANPVTIGTNTSEQWQPTIIGWNTFEVRTTLQLNSVGETCQSIENFERVKAFVFDTYTATATATGGSCGNNSVKLGATIVSGSKGAAMTEFNTPGYITPDGYTGQWEVTGPSGYTSSPSHFIPAVNDPNAEFKPGMDGDYVLAWKLTPTAKGDDGKLIENTSCPPTPALVDVKIQPCFALDFDGVDDYVNLVKTYNDGPYSVEAWIRPESKKADGTDTNSAATIISGPNFEITMADLPATVVPDTRWYHIAASNGRLYVDGIDIKEFSLTGGSERAFIGAKWNSSKTENHFSGWIEEVRIWNGNISQKNIQFTMNQRLKADGNIGVEVDMVHPDAPAFTSLAGYYQLLATNILTGGYTENLAGSVDGKLRNMETLQENTAPLPYTTFQDNSLWTDGESSGPWTHWDVWDIPNANGINGDPIEWNIVRTSNYVDSGEKNIKILGLIVESNELDIINTTTRHNANGHVHTETNSGQSLEVTHYLKIDGLLDLTGESQLLQPEGSIVDAASTGALERDQQGTASSYNYNYWSSPVSPRPNNGDYSVASVMKDGSTQTPQDITFGPAYAHADGDFTTPRRVSEYWLHSFKGTANEYAVWHPIGSTGEIKVGEGYSMKGTSGKAAIKDPQNYTFKGIPNNGDVNLSIGTGQNYLIGNPYPSAIDANQFIWDNLKIGNKTANVFNGTLYFWDHFSGKTHYLQEYIGGYAMYNLSGSVIAISIDERINANENEGEKRPGQFIPVGQGFFINTMGVDTLSTTTISGGNFKIKNQYRIFKRELDKDPEGKNESVFHSQERKDIATATTNNSSSQEVEQNKIWLKFKSPKGYHRQILVTADQRATENFDLGFDAPMIDENVEDMYWYFNKYQFVIQGVPDFNIERVLDLGINVEQKGALSISIDDLDNIPDEMNIYLADSLNQVVHDLRAEPYETESEAGTFTDRFKLVFQDKTQIEEPEVPVIEEGPFEVLYVTGTRNVLLRNPELLEVDRVYLNNMLGQQVHVYYNVPSEKEVELPVKRFSAGVYIVKVHYEGGIITRKVILE